MFHPTIDLKNHLISPNHAIDYQIIQVGTGGSGGYLVQRLSKLLYSLSEQNHMISYILIDGDSVEENNLLRQPFLEDDLGQPKAEILAKRYQDAYGIPILYKNEYIEKVEDILDCISYSGSWLVTTIPVIIGMVDNNATRQILNELFERSRNIIYIDAGNDGIDLSEPLEDQIKAGYSGQVVIGAKIQNKVLAEPVGSIYPDILEDKESRLPTQACGEVVAYSPQRMQTNEVSSLVTMGYLNNLLCQNEILSHYTNFNARKMVIKPTYFPVVKEKVS